MVHKLLWRVPVKEFSKWLIFSKDIHRSLMIMVFWLALYVLLWCVYFCADAKVWSCWRRTQRTSRKTSKCRRSLRSSLRWLEIWTTPCLTFPRNLTRSLSWHLLHMMIRQRASQKLVRKCMLLLWKQKRKMVFLRCQPVQCLIRPRIIQSRTRLHWNQARRSSWTVCWMEERMATTVMTFQGTNWRPFPWINWIAATAQQP